MRMTAEMIVKAIGELPKDREYAYANERTSQRIRVVSVKLPLGPIKFQRYSPAKGESPEAAKIESISTKGILRVANAIAEGVPFNIDRILAGSYNFRSVLEALLAATPQFYICKPGRIELEESFSSIKPGHKHLLWLPAKPHQIGKVLHESTDLVIDEIPITSATFEPLVMPSAPQATVDPTIKRAHAMIQVSLVEIGEKLGMSPFVAKNDQAIEYQGRRLVERPNVVADLRSVQWLQTYSQAIEAGSFIDCIWFRNGKFMPAVIEIEHSTGVTSGLSRMRTFADNAPPIDTKYVVAAPDEDREKVLSEFTKEQFRSLRPAYLPYSAVRELLGLVQRRNLRGAVTDKFLEAFMERAA